MTYTDTTTVRLLTNLTISDISDSDLTSIITQATVQINSDINIKIDREFVRPLDQVRQNKIDGSNTVFYVRNWFGKFFADRNNDETVTTGDIIVHQVDTIGNETTLTVSSIDDDDSNITLSTAPSSGVRLFITYSYSYVRQLSGSVDPRLKLATTFLAAAYGYAKVNWGRAPSSQYASTKLTRHMEAYNEYYKRYLELIKQIQDIGGIVQSAENIHTF